MFVASQRSCLTPGGDRRSSRDGNATLLNTRRCAGHGRLIVDGRQDHGFWWRMTGSPGRARRHRTSSGYAVIVADKAWVTGSATAIQRAGFGGSAWNCRKMTPKPGGFRTGCRNLRRRSLQVFGIAPSKKSECKEAPTSTDSGAHRTISCDAKRPGCAQPARLCQRLILHAARQQALFVI